jgi:hypothetical protein
MRDVIQDIRGHLARAWRRLVPPKQVRVGDVFIRIDPQAMPKSLIRAILRGDYELPSATLLCECYEQEIAWQNSEVVSALSL